MVTGVLSGAGDIASYLNTATLQEIAQFTCEAHYGTGNCLQGACGPLSYYYRNGGLSCNCGKAAGELEWVYSNDGAKHVSEDYSEDDGGVTPAVDIENHDLFVRRRTSADCTQSSWEIALKSLGLDKMPAYHLALDLRASDFTGGTSWASRVGGLSASVPAGMAFDPDEQAFVFDRTQVMTVDLATSKLSLPRVTYSAWVKVPRELPDDTKRDWVLSQYPSPSMQGRALTIGDNRMGYTSVSRGSTGNWDSALGRPDYNTWVHVVGTYVKSLGTAKAYLNGVASAQTTASTTDPGNGDPAEKLIIGGYDAGSNLELGLHAWLSDVQVFDRDLTDAEVRELYLAGRPSHTDVLRNCVPPTSDDAQLVASYTTCLARYCEDAPPAFLTMLAGSAVSGCGALTCGNTALGNITVSEACQRSCPSSIPVDPVRKQAACDSAGLMSLSPAACSAAATALGLSVGNTISGSSSGPLGCSYDGTDLYLEGDGSAACSSSRECICAFEVCATSVPLMSAPSNPTTTSSVWAVEEGKCRTDDRCVMSPQYPLPPENGATCNFTGPELPLAVTVFDTEDSVDYLLVDGTTYDGMDSPAGVVPSGELYWSSDGANPSKGWKICADNSGLDDCIGNCASGAEATCGDGASCPELVDGVTASSGASSPVTTCDQRSWVQVKLATAVKINRVTLYAGSAGHCGRRVELSTDGENWTTAFDQGPGYGPSEASTTFNFERQRAYFVRVSSSKSDAEDVAKFHEVQVRDVACQDDANWTDSVWGDGTRTCASLNLKPTWCIDRGPYSELALRSCPVACGTCEAAFEPSPTYCNETGLLDESSTAPAIHSALECFYHCIALPTCKYFRWEAGVSCARFSACTAGQAGATATAQFFKIPRKAEPLDFKPLINRLTWRGYFQIKTDYQQCGNPIFDMTWCETLLLALGVTNTNWYRYSDPQTYRPYGCSYSGSYLYINTNANSDRVCGQSGYSCVCPAADGVGTLVKEVAWAARDDVHLPATNFGTRGQEVTFCNIRSTRCHGQQRSLIERTGLFAGIRLGAYTFPAPADWDGDGDIDLLFGRAGGTLVFIENVNGKFDLTTIIGTSRTTLTNSPCYQVWSSNVDPLCSMWCCYDAGVGDLCYTDQGWKVCSTASPAFNVSTSGDRLAPQAVDWDGDGAKDIIGGSCSGHVQLWLRTSTGLVLQTGADNPFRSLGLNGCVVPHATDWDGDGDLDLLVGDQQGFIHYFENLGAGALTLVSDTSSPLFRVRVEGNAAPFAGDWDGDGDKDLIVGTLAGNIAYFEHVKHGSLVKREGESNPFNAIVTTSHSMPAFIDWNGDGLMDLMVADGSQGTYTLYETREEDTMTEREGAFSPFGAHEVYHRAAPAVVDWNADGSPDVIVVGMTGEVAYFEGTQDGTLLRMLGADNPFRGLDMGKFPAAQVVDWQGDGMFDFLVGAEDSTLKLFTQGNGGALTLDSSDLINASSALGTYLVPHAVDWDGDGELELILGDSGVVPLRTITLAGFGFEAWNTQFVERREPKWSINGRETYFSASGLWYIFQCSYGDNLWNIGANETFERNKNLGQCSSVARVPSGADIVDATMSAAWEVFGAYGGTVTAVPSGTRAVRVAADGTASRPNCDTCNNREQPECQTCTITMPMQLECAKELCQAAEFDSGVPVTLSSVPLSECQCVDTDGDGQDAYGAGCSSYVAGWCGFYDDDDFTANDDCCVCGGGAQGNGSQITGFAFSADCFMLSSFVGSLSGRVDSITPAPSNVGSLRYFKRLSAGEPLQEVAADQNPFSSITATEALPFPVVVDFDGDGDTDLVVGLSSVEVKTVTSDGSAAKPHCSSSKYCVWNAKTQARCARGLCQAQGYATGRYISHTGDAMCTATSTTNAQSFDISTGSVAQASVVMTPITAECRRGGAVKLWERTDDGSLVEKAGTSNPFDPISVPVMAAPVLTDWDRDTALEVLVGDNSLKLRFFEQGILCEHEEPCNFKGLCDKVLGVCKCVAGHQLGDCSRCDGDYYTERGALAAVDTCLPCSGLGTEAGMCAQRGTCNDDVEARLLARQGGGTNSTASFFTGNGSCACSPYYSGVDVFGRSTCAEGACPAGKEPILAATGVIACKDCPQGYSKATEANEACTICAKGSYSTGGAAQCTACAPGYNQPLLGASRCDACMAGEYPSADKTECLSCPTGKFSPTAASNQCTECVAGRFSANPGEASCTDCDAGKFSAASSAACSNCPVGHFSSTASSSCNPCQSGYFAANEGSAVCDACSEGTFSGPGVSACTNCAAGKYTNIPGSDACTDCPMGKYSGVEGAVDAGTCEPCPVGTWSATSGISLSSACVSCNPGATTASTGSRNANDCIQPDANQDQECIAGRSCVVVGLQGNRLGDGHVMAVLPEDGSESQVEGVESKGFSRESSGGSRYEWIPPFVPEGGKYMIKWCPGIHTQCVSFARFGFEVGSLKVLGPVPRDFACVRGRPCQGLGPLLGVGLATDDRIQVHEECGDGPVKLTGSNPEGNATSIVSINHVLPSDVTHLGAGSLALLESFEVGFGTDFVSALPRDSYQLCWCAMGRGVADACGSARNFMSVAGHLEVMGPRSGQEVFCYLGQHCVLTEIAGVNVQTGDRIIVVEDCGSDAPVLGVPGAGVAETTDADTSIFNFHNNNGQLDSSGDERVLKSVAGISRLCYCRAEGPNWDCSDPVQFLANVGLFTAKGPYSNNDRPCYVGADCTIENINGVGLANGDEVTVGERMAQGECESGEPASNNSALGLPTTAAQGTAKGKTFNLGNLPSTAVPGDFPMCWAPASRLNQPKHRARLGTLYVTCPAGSYRLEADGTFRCEPCPIGHYCTGGTSAGGYHDDVKVKCASGQSTLGKNATSEADCLCDKGMYLGADGCTECPAGSFKANISNNASCPGQCPNGTTSREAAQSADDCYALQDSSSMAEAATAEVFVMEGSLTIPNMGCPSEDEFQKLKNAMLLALAESTGEAAQDIEIDFPKPADCGRRLQGSAGGSSTVTYKIRKPTQADADRVSQNVNIAEVETMVRTRAGDVVPNLQFTNVVTPAVNSAVLNCSDAGQGKAFMLGGRPTSLDDCRCAAGYTPSTGNRGVCEPCAQGFFKPDIGDTACIICPAVTVGGVSVRLMTLQGASTSNSQCTCPGGYYTTPGSPLPPSTCLQCGIGHYCIGGYARTRCAAGSTTFGEIEQNFEQCVCEAGFTPLVVRNATHRCGPCEGGFFKMAAGDSDCSQRCRPNGYSNPGAKHPDDCFCVARFHYQNYSDTCEQCPVDGVECIGGFDPPDSRNHADPRSQDGYYMTRYANGEKCDIELPDAPSACFAGATLENFSTACGGLQTGIMCGACQFMSARDIGTDACIPCDGSRTDLAMIFALNTDLFLKAGFGIFLGKQALDSAIKVKKMDAIVLRILLQWVMTTSVLGAFDLSEVGVFDWSKKDMEAEQAEEASAQGASAMLAARAQGLSFKFNFPPWFKPVMNSMTAIRSGLPSPESPQVSLECMAQRQVTNPDPEKPSELQLFVPALYWLLYPIFVMMYVLLLSFVLAKIAYPLTLMATRRAARKLEAVLIGMGCSVLTAQAAAEALTPDLVIDLLEDPAQIFSVAALVQFFGKEVMAEVVAVTAADKISEPLLDGLRNLLASDNLPENMTDVVKTTVKAGAEGLVGFIKVVAQAIPVESIAAIFEDPMSVPQSIMDFVSEMDLSEAFDAEALAVGAGEATGGAAEGLNEAAEEGEIQQAEQVAAAVGGDDSMGKGYQEEIDYVVFGIYRSTRAVDIIRDSVPLFLVTAYTLWDVVTRRMLSLIQMRKVLLTISRSAVGLEVQTIQTRWLYDMRLQGFTGQHLNMAIIGVTGLGIWSVGILVFLFLFLRANKHRLQETHMLRKVGYFYNGLEPDTYWWDVVVKKGDILLLYAVTFTEIFSDARAKLIMYLGCAGMFWAAHNMYHPFDDRQNCLADRLEGQGLSTRFATIFLLQMLLMLNGGPNVNAVFAVILIVANGLFLLTALFILIVEIPGGKADGDNDTADAAKDQAANSASKAMPGGGGNPIMMAANWLLGKLIKPLIALVLKIGSIFSREKENIATQVPHCVWQGPGKDLLIVTHHDPEPPFILRRLARKVISHIYQLGDEDQRAFLASVIGQILDHLLTNSGFHRIPGDVMDFIFLLPTALKRFKGEEGEEEDEGPHHIKVARYVRRLYKKALAEAETMGSVDGDGGMVRQKSTFTKKNEFDYIFSPEELLMALLFIQRLELVELHDAVTLGCYDLDPEQEAEASRGSFRRKEEMVSI